MSPGLNRCRLQPTTGFAPFVPSGVLPQPSSYGSHSERLFVSSFPRGAGASRKIAWHLASSADKPETRGGMHPLPCESVQTVRFRTPQNGRPTRSLATPCCGVVPLCRAIATNEPGRNAELSFETVATPPSRKGTAPELLIAWLASSHADEWTQGPGLGSYESESTLTKVLRSHTL